MHKPNTNLFNHLMIRFFCKRFWCYFYLPRPCDPIFLPFPNSFCMKSFNDKTPLSDFFHFSFPFPSHLLFPSHPLQKANKKTCMKSHSLSSHRSFDTHSTRNSSHTRFLFYMILHMIILSLHIQMEAEQSFQEFQSL